MGVCLCHDLSPTTLYWCSAMYDNKVAKLQFRNTTEAHRLLKKAIVFESVVFDVEKGGRKSIKRSLHVYGRENVKYIYIAK